MKKFLLFLLTISILIFPQTSKAEYFRDIIVTSSDGIWTDARAYTNLNNAISDIGANERTIVITEPQIVTTLTVPSNITLKFERNGSITNSGTLTLQTKNIISGDRQIFTGVGDISFASGSIIRSSWFSNTETAFALTNDDTVTLVISKAATLTASFAVGNNVTLCFEAPGNILTTNAGVTISNIGQIQAGDYQIFSGSGDFSFISGTTLKVSWFNRLRSAITYIGTDTVNLIQTKSETLDTNVSIGSNINFIVSDGAVITTGGNTLSFLSNHKFSNKRQIFNAGEGDIVGLSLANPILWKNNSIPGITDMTDAFKCAIASVDTTTYGSGEVQFEGNNYLSSAITTKSYLTLRGINGEAELSSDLDIEFINSPTTTVSTAISEARFYDFYIKKNISGLTTKYDIHLQNPNICRLERIRVQSGHDDSDYSSVNVGGVFFDRPTGSTSTSFMNTIKDCWIQNNSIYFYNITDSSIEGGWIWGHTRQFTIKLHNGGNIEVSGVKSLICSKYNGGIWIDGTSFTMGRFFNNAFDGGVATVDNGSAIYSPQQSYNVKVTNNEFWSLDKHGIDTTDPVGWVISYNNFYKGNRADNYQDDIRITGSSFSPNNNVISSNGFFNDVAKTNKGYAIREYNGGFSPTYNIYQGNGVYGSTAYATPYILTVSANYKINNSGTSNSIVNEVLLGNNLYIWWNGIIKSTSSLVNASGTLDLEITSTTSLGTAGGFSGILIVTSTRYNATTISRRTIYTVNCTNGSTAVFTPLASQDGSGGGASFTVAISTDGVIRFTDTLGQQVAVSMSFFGSRSLR